MKKSVQVILTIVGVIAFFIFCGLKGLSAEQSGRAFAMVLPAVIGYFLGLGWWKEYKEKQKNKEKEVKNGKEI